MHISVVTNIITMALFYYPCLLLVLSNFLLHEISAQPPYTTLVAPLLKHNTTSLYSVVLNQGENYLVDLDSPFTSFRCDNKFPSNVACSSQECLEARSYVSPFCPPLNASALPLGCTKFSGCAVTSVNPLTHSCALSELTHRDIIIDWTNGRNPTGTMDFNGLIATCTPSSLFQSIPNDIYGIASFSRFPLSLVSNLASKFAICLPSSSGSTRGVSFFGDGPYYINLPGSIVRQDKDMKSLLSYTPLLNSTNSSPGYYIGLKQIFINKNPLRVSLGNIRVKLSTVVPYTTLRSDIYKHFIRFFSEHIKEIPQVKAVTPFSLCITPSNSVFKRLVFSDLQINFHLENGSIWTIHPENYLKTIGSNLLCLALVDGGKTTQDAVVIGSFQMENNFLFFDLEKSVFGFSSSLILEKTNCGNFNYTTVT